MEYFSEHAQLIVVVVAVLVLRLWLSSALEIFLFLLPLLRRSLSTLALLFRHMINIEGQMEGSKEGHRGVERCFAHILPLRLTRRGQNLSKKSQFVKKAGFDSFKLGHAPVTVDSDAC